MALLAARGGGVILFTQGAWPWRREDLPACRVAQVRRDARLERRGDVVEEGGPEVGRGQDAVGVAMYTPVASPWGGGIVVARWAAEDAVSWVVLMAWLEWRCGWVM